MNWQFPWKKMKGCNGQKETRKLKSLKRVLVAACLLWGMFVQAGAEPIQRIDVTIKNFRFMTTQTPLQLLLPTLIVIRNEDEVRHGFTSDLFRGTPMEVESASGVIYGQGIEGLYVDPREEVAIRLTIERSGDYKFHCTIHPDMKGEILLIGVEAV